MSYKRKSIMDIFGLTEEETDKLVKEVRHAHVDSENMEELAKMIGLNIEPKIAFKGYLYGRIIAENEELGRRLQQ